MTPGFIGCLGSLAGGGLLILSLILGYKEYGAWPVPLIVGIIILIGALIGACSDSCEVCEEATHLRDPLCGRPFCGDHTTPIRRLNQGGLQRLGQLSVNTMNGGLCRRCWQKVA